MMAPLRAFPSFFHNKITIEDAHINFTHNSVTFL